MPVNQEDEEYELPLSLLERDMWTFDNLLNEPVYNVHSSLLVEGDLDSAALRTAAQSLINDHSILRSRYRIRKNSGPRRVIVHDKVVTLIEREVSEPFADAIDLISKDIMQPFDLANQSLFRIYIHRMRPNASIITIVLHHLICDRDSLATVWTLLARRYGGVMIDPPQSRDPYTSLLQMNKRGSTADRQEEYWRNQLRGAPVEAPLQKDRHPSAAITCTRGSKLLMKQPPDVIASVAEIQRRGAGTPSMVYIAASALAAAAHTGASDVSIGMPSSRPAVSRQDDALGVRVNLLPIRVRIFPDTTLSTVLRQVRGVVADALDNGDVSAMSILREVAPPSRQFDPLIYCTVGVYEAVAPSIHFGGHPTKEIEIDGRQSLYPINLQLPTGSRAGERIVTFQTEIYNQSSVVQWINSIDRITATIASHPETIVSDLLAYLRTAPLRCKATS